MKRKMLVCLMILIGLLFLNMESRAFAQDGVEETPGQAMQQQPSEQTKQEGPSPAAPKSEFSGWFNRTGSGLFISLTPFATAVAILILLLILVVPIAVGTKRQKRSRGYFKTIPHAR